MTLIVSDIGKNTNRIDPPPPPLSPYGYYGCFNFIFDTTGIIYFYQLLFDRIIPSVKQIDYDSYAPVFINLSPNEIIILPGEAIKEFVEQNILKVDIAFRIVRIIGMTDTIQSNNLSPLLEMLHDTSNNIFYFVRTITYEENLVLEHKKKQQIYNPNNIDWDSTKVWIDKKRN